jgi:hypothetical protein
MNFINTREENNLSTTVNNCDAVLNTKAAKIHDTVIKKTLVKKNNKYTVVNLDKYIRTSIAILENSVEFNKNEDCVFAIYKEFIGNKTNNNIFMTMTKNRKAHIFPTDNEIESYILQVFSNSQ